MVVPQHRNSSERGLPCPACKRPMTPLFFSAACDFCDGKADPQFHSGFVIYRGDRGGEVLEEYVFRNETDAFHWRALMNLEAYDVRRVYCEHPFRWRQSNGSVRGIELADHLYSIYPDRRYEPVRFRAHLA